MDQTYEVTVRWDDGYLEKFEAHSQPRFGSDLLFFRWENEEGIEINRHIPLRGVRWFSVFPPSKE